MPNGSVALFRLTAAERTALEGSRTLGGIPSLPGIVKVRTGQIDGQHLAAVYVPTAATAAFWAAVQKPPEAGPWAADQLLDVCTDDRDLATKARAALASANEF